MSATEAILRGRNIVITFSVLDNFWLMKLGENLTTGHYALLFSMSATGSFICQVTEAWLDIPRPLITQSGATGVKDRTFSISGAMLTQTDELGHRGVKSYDRFLWFHVILTPTIQCDVPTPTFLDGETSIPGRAISTEGSHPKHWKGKKN